MRSLVIAAILSGFVLPMALPAEAQTRLPRTSPAERKVKAINRNLQQEQRLQKLEQQIQIDNNQFRQQVDRHRLFTTPRPAARIGICPPGSVMCN